MTRPRYSLAQLMAILVYLGFGFAALRNADEFWATATYSIAVLTIAAAPVGAIARRGAARSTWAGFAVFGWTYLVALELPDWWVGGFGFGRIQKPVLLIEWGITRLQPTSTRRPEGAIWPGMNRSVSPWGSSSSAWWGRSWVESSPRRTNGRFCDR
jgi:hypothetical protein